MCASSILFALYLNAARAGPCSGQEEGADAISRHGQRAPVDQQDDQQHIPECCRGRSMFWAGRRR
jgi:hypothetical protein